RENRATVPVHCRHTFGQGRRAALHLCRAPGQDRSSRVRGWHPDVELWGAHMGTKIRSIVLAISIVAATLTAGMLSTTTAQASTTVQDRIVNDVPANWTPTVGD